MSQDLLCFGLVALSHKSLISPEVPVSATDAPVQAPAHTHTQAESSRTRVFEGSSAEIPQKVILKPNRELGNWGLGKKINL